MSELIRVLIKDLRVGSLFNMISGTPGKVLERSENGFGTTVQLKRTTTKNTTSTSVQYERVVISENCPVWVKR